MAELTVQAWDVEVGNMVKAPGFAVFLTVEQIEERDDGRVGLMLEGGIHLVLEPGQKIKVKRVD